MELKELEKIIFVSGDDNCIIDFAHNFDGDCIGIMFYAYAIYNDKKFEELKVTHYYNDDVLALIANGKTDEVGEIERDTYDCFVNFDDFELDDGLEGRFKNENEVIIEGVKIPCEIVGDEFDYDDFTSEFEKL